MKRKLAFLLAAVMTMSVLPMNLFAATDNRIVRPYDSLGENTLLVEPGASDLGNATLDGVDEVATGTYLNLEFKDDFISGESFRITLDNAKWAFHNGTNTNVPNWTSVSSASVAALYTQVVAADEVLGAAISRSSIDPADISGSSKLDGLTAGQYTYSSNTGIYLYTRSAYRGVYFGGVDVDAGVNPATTAKYGMAILNNTVAEVTWVSDTPLGTSTAISIPLVVIAEDDTKPVTVTIDGGKTSRQTLTLVGAVSGATTAKIASIITSRDDVEVDTITITETRVGSIKRDSSFTLYPPSGYTFDDANKPVATAYRLSGSSLEEDLDVTIIPSRITVKTDGLGGSSTATGWIDIKGIIVVPRNDNTWGSVEGLRIVGGTNSGISDHTFGEVARRLDYGVNIKASDSKEGVPELVVGYHNAISAAGLVSGQLDDSFKLMGIRIEENTVNSWLTQRPTRVTLPEGVLIRAVEVTDHSDGVTGAAASPKIVTGAPSTAMVSFDENVLTLRNIKNGAADDTEKAWIDLDIYVSISYSMAGEDIEVEVTGDGVGDVEPFLVAKAIAPVTVEVESVTAINASGARQRTADIVITEAYAGALLDESTHNLVRIALIDARGGRTARSNFFPLYFSDADYEVEEGDIEIENFAVGLTNVAQGAANDVTGEIRFNVKSESTEAATIRIKDVRVDSIEVSSSVREQGAYSALVYGSSIARNFPDDNSNDDEDDGYFTDILENAGAVSEYVRVSDNVVTGLKDGLDPASTTIEISVTPGDEYYIIENGEKKFFNADSKPFIQDGTTYVPVRFLTEIFVESDNVSWDEATRSVFLNLPRGLVKLTVGSAEFSVGNERGVLTGSNGVTAPLLNIEGRTFIPVRALCENIFGATIDWDNEDGKQIIWFNK